MLRRLGTHDDPRVRASVAISVPAHSEVLDAARLVSRRVPDRSLRAVQGARPLPDREALLGDLRVALADDDPLVRLLAAGAWEGNGGARLDGYDPRDDDRARAAALAALEERLARAGAASAPAVEPQPAAAAGAPAQPAPRRFTADQLASVEQSLRALGWMHEVWVRPGEMGREPTSLRELRTTPPFDQHGIGDVRVLDDGTLRHARSGYIFRLAARPDGPALAVWADPPPGAVEAPTFWYDRVSGVVRRRE